LADLIDPDPPEVREQVNLAPRYRREAERET